MYTIQNKYILFFQKQNFLNIILLTTDPQTKKKKPKIKFLFDGNYLNERYDFFLFYNLFIWICYLNF